MNENYQELSQIDAKYRSKIYKGQKTIRIDVDDYIALFNMAEIGVILMQEEEDAEKE